MIGPKLGAIIKLGVGVKLLTNGPKLGAILKLGVGVNLPTTGPKLGAILKLGVGVNLLTTGPKLGAILKFGSASQNRSNNYCCSLFCFVFPKIAVNDFSCLYPLIAIMYRTNQR